jgi:hypothetical protein
MKSGQGNFEVPKYLSLHHFKTCNTICGTCTEFCISSVFIINISWSCILYYALYSYIFNFCIQNGDQVYSEANMYFISSHYSHSSPIFHDKNLSVLFILQFVKMVHHGIYHQLFYLYIKVKHFLIKKLGKL